MSPNDFIWQPNATYLNCRVTDFMHQEGIKTWKELIRRSTEDIEWFWKTALEFMGFQWQRPYDQLLNLTKGFPWASWFNGGQINIVENCLDWHRESGKILGHRQSVGAEHPALIWENEEGDCRKLTYGQLSHQAGQVAAFLLSKGLSPGDAVGIYMPMVPEVVSVMFGCMKIGAVPVPVFSGFGPQALFDRLLDCKAKILFTADAGRRRGKIIPIKQDVDSIAQRIPTLRQVVVLNHCHTSIQWHKEKDLHWEEVIESASSLDKSQVLAADHPAIYLYTSGTTGKPKGTVHTHGGTLAQVAKEVGFAFDTRPQDVFFWFTDIGWMMGPWEMIGVTFWGGTLLIFEGAPNYPRPKRLFEIVDRHQVTTLGISPTVVRVLLQEKDFRLEQTDLSSLRFLGSTGETWDKDSYMWFFEKIGKKRCPIINISGGTELIGCLLQPLPVIPLKPCTLGAQGLGMDVDVFDESGKSVQGAIGHLVCKKPAPSMTRGFLGDPNRYLNTYFNRFPGVWYHGDWAKVDEDGLWFLFGRSDDTIKVAGKRVGPAEVEDSLISHPSVVEAAAIGVPHQIKGEVIVCFVVARTGTELSSELVAQLEDVVAKLLGKTFKPESIYFVPALPKTRSGKIVRAALRNKYLGNAVGDLSNIENPDSLEMVAKVLEPLKNTV